MIIEFTVENYKSLRDKQVFSLVPSNYFQEELENVIPLSDDWKVLKSSVIYGAMEVEKVNFLKQSLFE